MSMPDFVEGDTGTTITRTCLNSAGTAINLTTYTVKVYWREVSNGYKRGATMTKTDAANGVVAYTFLANELNHGTIEMEFELTDGSGLVTTSRDAKQYTVRARVSPSPS